jgi:16S rRNA (cytosine967-C5)-methyltransferase
MSARDDALFELDRRLWPGWPPRLLRGRAPFHRDAGALRDPRDLALAEHIHIGVVKNLLLLQHLTAHYSGRSLKSIDPLVQKILAVGLYQLRFLTRIPASAAVNEAVEQAKRFGRAKAAGFVNAVLRKAAADPNPPLPDRATDPARYAEVVLSHPRSLFERYAAMLGVEDALRLCEHDNAEPPTIVRLGLGAAPADLQGEGVTVEPHEQPGLCVVHGARKATLAEWARVGVAQVQDTTAAAVVQQLRCELGQRVLDRCAGLGTKTIQLRDGVGEVGSVVAMDPNPERCNGLSELLGARQIANVAVHCAGLFGDVPELGGATFDRALIDVPCSNSGVLARRPEARYGQRADSLGGLREIQDLILDDTADHVRPGGLMLYSTCSIWPEENERQVERFLRRRPDYALVKQHATTPSLDPEPTRYRDGGFFALLQRA